MKLSVMILCIHLCMSIMVVQGYINVTFDLRNDIKSYSNFLERSRNVAEAPTRACGLRSTRRTPTAGAEYIHATLKFSNNQWLTLGIDAKDFYVWGYQDNLKYNGTYRASFLRDAPDNLRENIFPGSTIRISNIGANYKILESTAGVNRKELVLGIRNLEGAIRTVYGKQVNLLHQNVEAKFFLVTIQMVSEAVRFKFMEEAIVGNHNTPEMKRKMVAYQNDWNDISDAIHRAEAEKLKCTKIIPTLVISNIDYRKEVHTIAEIKNDMGLLKFSTTKN